MIVIFIVIQMILAFFLTEIPSTLIEDLLISFFNLDSSGSFRNKLYIDKYKVVNFINSLDYYLQTSKAIKKFDINYLDLSSNYAQNLADLIIKHSKLGNIEYFAGYNLKMLIDNKVEILELIKKKDLNENYFHIEILSGIL